MSRTPALAGCTILVTRPQEQASGLCEAIAAAGGQPLLFPALAIEAAAGQAAVERLTHIDDYDWAIFVSANAVRYAQKAFDNGIIPPTSTVRVAAVGAATAQALREAGVGAVLTPPEPGDSEALAALAELQEVAGRRCLIVRGAGGRELLADTLRQRGALVEYAEVYRRVRPKTDAGPLLDRWRQGEVHGVVVTSGEALSNLTAMVGFEGVALLRKTPLVTVSERVRQQALVLGVRQVASAEGAADAALVQALAELLSDRVNEQLQARGPGTVTDQDKQPKPAELSAGVSLGSAAPVAENSPPAAKIKPVKTKPARRAWIGYVILLLVVGIVVGGYFLMQQIRSTQEGLGGELSKEDREIAELNTQVADLQAVFKTLHGQMATLETRLSTEDNKVERVLGEQSAQFSEKLEQFRGEVRDDLQVLHRMLGKTRSDWLVADAEYLLGAALQRLHLVGDVKTAIAALEGADERLRESGEPAVFKVREQLANEIRILKSFTPPDLIGASSRLLALEAKVRELPLLLPHAGKGVSSAGSPDGAHGAPKTAAPGEADSITDSLMGELGKYVSIRRLDKPVASVLTPEETLVLRQILLLKLETARMALVRGDDALYKASLETARLWLAENFDDGQAAVRSVDGDIRALMEQPIQVAYPEIGKALAMLRDITKLRVEADGVVADKEKSRDKGEKKAAPASASGEAPPPAAAPAAPQGAQ
ncbi:fused uroporphyrinogen-III synthase HemD/membrane protein HemX [Methylogaea oryzae]|uniref:Tetrapyrrole biosynthesis uroporphyrinogen III synthase domain-containing protein n=1 Tax=Methylogaea oryzae TaxID=1295382 RepID=A0A8D4VSC7_9GAMM|nr:fused uroporphyrinogen-III synthase HemD/membrane protein HemX [Methylogaea oryzae]BBL72362.1 hypothetical protein MoryE10_29680 [Methylogaea oryzae]